MDDASFGPRLHGHFDLTLLFEHTIFYLVPSSIVVFVTPFYVHKVLRRGAPLVRPGVLLWAKLAVAAALVGVQFANVALWAQSPLYTRVTEAAAVMTAVSAACIAVLVYAGHVHHLRSLSFVGFFLSLSAVVDIAATLTYFNRDRLGSIARLHVAIPCLKFVLILLEEVSKRSLFRLDAVGATSLSKETTAGFWNRSTLAWVNHILLYGFRGGITPAWMPSLGPDYDSDLLYQEFTRQWGKGNHTSRLALPKAILGTVPWPFVFVILPRLLAIGFDFAQPFLLQDVANELAIEAPVDTYVSRGLIIATTIIYVCRAVARSWYSTLRNQISVSIRAILVSAVYHKSLKLSAETLDSAAAVTLVTADVSGVASLATLSYDSWANVLEVCLGVSIMGVFAGAATIFTAIPVIFTTIASVYVGRRLMQTRKAWNENFETRVAATSNILAQIKEAKMLGLSPMLSKRIHRQFDDEVRLMMINRKYDAVTMAVSSFAELLTPVFVVAAIIFWTRESEAVSASRIFTTLALVALITNPLYFLIHSVSGWSASFACMYRLQDYFNLPETEDTRQFTIENGQVTDEKSALATVSSTSPPANSHNEVAVSTSSSAYAIQLQDVTFLAKEITVLKKLSLKIKTGNKVAFFGPVGCGKSSLLRSVLGEIKPTSGTVTLATRSVAYCSQVAWVQNETIQDNVLGGRDFNETLYNKVIYVCALDVDIERLPEKDQTLAGSEGSNLSGGQKQRVSLARTLYVQADIIILDDVFSALDVKTSSLIRKRLFSDHDLLRPGKTTVLMATSMQGHLVHADVSYEMSGDGTAQLSTQHEKIRESFQEVAGAADAPLSSGSVSLSQKADMDKESDWDTPEVAPAPDTAVRDNMSSLRYGDRTIYKFFLQPAGVLRIIVWLLAVACASVADRMPPIFMRIWLERDAQNHLYFIGFAMLGVLSCCLYFFSPIVYYRLLIANCAPPLHQKLLDAVFFATFEFLAATDAGTLLNRFSQDMQMATQQLPLAITPTLWGFCSLIIDVGVITAGATYALPIIPVFLGVVFVIQHVYLRTSRQLRVIQLDSSKSLIRHLTESATGIEYIRAFKWQKNFTGQLHHMLDETQKPFYYLLALQQWLTSVMDFTTAGAAVCVVSLALHFKNTSSASAMGLSLLTLISFSDFTGYSVQWFVMMENMFGAVARIRDFSRSTPRESDEGTSSLPEHWPTSGKVEFQSISASYKMDTEKPHQALDGVSMTIEPGQTVGLVGRTGSGKSSMMLVLLRLLEYTGNIYIDGRELRTIPRNELRSRITTITQSGLALKASIRYNMNPFAEDEDSSADQQMVEILQRVGLWEHIEQRGGLEAVMSSMKFSVGQRQLFQLARAILHKDNTGSTLFLMDEGTSSIDEPTEQRIYSLIKECFAGCTKIIISHRDAVLADTDVVLHMSDGRGEVEMKTPRDTGDSQVKTIETTK